MRQVERGQLWVMRMHALIAGLILLIPAIIAAFVLMQNTRLPGWIIPALVLVAAAYAVLIAPVRRYRALRYALDAEELHIARGVWTQVETLVPLVRVQHIDVSQGPIERAFKVSRLVLHTAGTLNSLVVLPGLSREGAEAMRDEIRARIKQTEG